MRSIQGTIQFHFAIKLDLEKAAELDYCDVGSVVRKIGEILNLKNEIDKIMEKAS